MPKQVALYAMALKALIRHDKLKAEASFGVLNPKRNKINLIIYTKVRASKKSSS